MSALSPDHYKSDSVECIDAIRAALGPRGFMAYCQGNVIKYTWRLGHKDAPAIDAGKAAVYAAWIEDAIADRPLRKPGAEPSTPQPVRLTQFPAPSEG